MAWSQALLDFEAKLRQEGRREALQVTFYNLFLARFGTVDGALERTIATIPTLSPEAYNQIFPQLLTLSATELVAQFGERSRSEG